MSKKKRQALIGAIISILGVIGTYLIVSNIVVDKRGFTDEYDLGLPKSAGSGGGTRIK